MKRHISGQQLTSTGCTLSFDDPSDKTADWLLALFKDGLHPLSPDLTSVRGQLFLVRNRDNIDITGDFRVDCSPHCDRCSENYRVRHHVPIALLLVPHPEHNHLSLTKHGEAMNLSDEDIGVAFYVGDRLDLAPILSEYVALSLPQVNLCTERCRGLCPQCGQNLNTGPCQCTNESTADSRWDPLKGLKTGRQK